VKLLLDTQVFIWLINDDKRLGSKADNLLRDRSNVIYISYFSVFEMTIKSASGKLDFDYTVIDDLPKIDINLLMPDEKTLESYKIYNAANRDPFDNALITIAIIENFRLITVDKNILETTEVNLRLINAKQ
jgi:PIN domain nuclease of toxin-antitoxin system